MIEVDAGPGIILNSIANVFCEILNLYKNEIKYREDEYMTIEDGTP